MKPLIQSVLLRFPLGEPLRLVRIESDLWTQALEPDLQAPDEIQLPDDGVSADDRYADLLPAPQGDLQIAEPATPGRGPPAHFRSYWNRSVGPDHGLFGDVGSSLQRAISP